MVGWTMGFSMDSPDQSPHKFYTFAFTDIIGILIELMIGECRTVASQDYLGLRRTLAGGLNHGDHFMPCRMDKRYSCVVVPSLYLSSPLRHCRKMQGSVRYFNVLRDEINPPLGGGSEGAKRSLRPHELMSAVARYVKTVAVFCTKRPANAA